MNKVLVYDVETTISNNGNPYDQRNKVCYWGFLDDLSLSISRGIPSRDSLSGRGVVVGFNLKFDLAWARRYGVDLPSHIHDCQLAHFLLSGQSQAYPSLDGVADFYGLGHKLHGIAEKYWDLGIDTPDIPEEEMREYLEQDLRLTYAVYLKQMEEFEKNPQLYKLFELQMEDLFTLLEMEWNGQLVDVAQCEKKEKEAEEKIKNIEKELRNWTGDIPINFSSNDHLSCLLYGGTISVEGTPVIIGVYKTGPRQGQPKYKKVIYDFTLPRLIEPIKGSELQKEGYFSTDEPTLRSVKASKGVKYLLDLLLERSGLEKLRGTYYAGIPAKIRELSPADGLLHGQFNQCVARTGRLSSSKPNLQNMSPEMKLLMVSRYE